MYVQKLQHTFTLNRVFYKKQYFAIDLLVAWINYVQSAGFLYWHRLWAQYQMTNMDTV